MPKKAPAYLQRKGYDQALVTLSDSITKERRDYWLGPYGSLESRELYHRLLGEWEANHRRLPERPDPAGADNNGLTIAEMILAYHRWAQSMRYSEAEMSKIKVVCRLLRQS